MNRVLASFYSWSDHLAVIWRSRRIVTLAQSGQGLAEYALILALIAIVAIIALIFLGHQVSKILSSVGHSI
jgi:pilus assembly protein Flp/PilA